MLIASPVIRVRQCKARPKLTHCKHFFEFFDEGFLASEELNEPFSIVRHCEAIMPCISLDIVVGKDIDSFPLAERYEAAILELWIEESSIFVPDILVEFGPVSEVIHLLSFV